MKKAKVLLTPAVIVRIDQLAANGGTYDSIATEIGVTKVKLRAWEKGNWSVFQALAPAFQQQHGVIKVRRSRFDTKAPL